jgi:AcrR family transcriptional regulator
VAREVFLELGIRATTSEVASRAGIAEGTIFHRFKSKEELFRSAMNFDPDAALSLVEALLTQAGAGEVRATLIAFAERVLEFGRVAMPVMVMSWSNPEHQMCAERTSERASRYHRTLSALSTYLASEMASGRLRRGPVETMARMLIGSLHHYCMMQHFVSGPSDPLSQKQFAEQVVDVLLGAGEGSAHETGPGPEGVSS